MAWRRVGALLGLASIALGACAPAENQQAGPAAPAAPGIALYALDCGRIVTSDAGPFSDDHAYDGQARELVDPCYLIRHPGGDQLWDAGFPEAVAAMPQGLSDGPFHITVARTLSAQLSEVGVQPKDIELFSVSHSPSEHVAPANRLAPLGDRRMTQRTRRGDRPNPRTAERPTAPTTTSRCLSDT